MATETAIFNMLMNWAGTGLMAGLFILLFARLGWLPTVVVMAVSDSQLNQMEDDNNV